MTVTDFRVDQFHIVSYGNGFAYAVADVTDGERSFHLQGEDADQFRRELDAADASPGPYRPRHVIADYMDALSN